MDKFDKGVTEVATAMCRSKHKVLDAPCTACLISAARADERIVVETAVRAVAAPAVLARVTSMRRMRAAGIRVSEIMARLGATYSEVWTALHAWPGEAPARPIVSRRPIASPMFVGVAA
ncbi:hypothetical protein [Stackebrandtia soli]|uniref:hypothetical protein n=1 Tax=Stackebrandtia soli TaxID=1892856 RepID=UPI0039E8BD6E